MNVAVNCEIGCALATVWTRAPFSRAANVVWMLEILARNPMVFTDYAARLAARPALQRAEARNAAIAAEHGLPQG